MTHTHRGYILVQDRNLTGVKVCILERCYGKITQSIQIELDCERYRPLTVRSSLLDELFACALICIKNLTQHDLVEQG